MNVGYITNGGERTGVEIRARKIREEIERISHSAPDGASRDRENRNYPPSLPPSLKLWRSRKLRGTRENRNRKDEKVKREINFELIHLNGEKGELSVNNKTVKTIKRWPWMDKKSVNWVRLGKLINHKADLYDLTNQSLSWLAKQLKPAVVTVHDLIEVTLPQDRLAYYLNRYLYSGIREAVRVIAVSNFAADQVSERYGISRGQIQVVYNGVDQNEFYPLANFKQSIGYLELRKRLRLEATAPVMLYVGSEQPRKNMAGLLAVVEKVKRKHSNVILFKVGQAGLRAGRAATLQLIDELKLKESVRIIEMVSQEELNELYNLADVLVTASKNEGFCLPVIEAMAAGTPVVCSNAAAIREVAGEAAILLEPDDVEGIAAAVVRLLEDQNLREGLVKSGGERVRKFSWKKAAQDVYGIYQDVLMR